MVGTVARMVGRTEAIFAKSVSGVQRSGKSAAVAPTEKGKRRLVPVAYPKKSFGTESVTSSGPISSSACP